MWSGCTLDEVSEEPDPQREPVAWMFEHTEDYLAASPTWRRERIEQTLWQAELGYSSKMLDGYGLEQEGWELLYAYDFPVQPLAATEAPHVRTLEFEGMPLLQNAKSKFGDDPTRWTQAQWQSFGEDVFWQMPMRKDNYFEWLLGQPELWDDLGLSVDEMGNLRGVTRYRDIRGDVQVGMSCALCHAADGVQGRAVERLDLGMARAKFRESRGLEADVYAQWGAGKVDVTDDDVLDPMAIPNLWGMKYQRYFNASGVIRVETPASAAIRFETQYMMNHGYEVRAPREYTWALAMYLYGLSEPDSEPMSDAAHRGEEVFGERCASCHVPERGYSGDLVTATALVGLDMVAATSLDRGTGSYRVPSLIGVGEGGPYFHDSSAKTLGDVLAGGHPMGGELDEDDMSDLILFLKTL